MDVSGELALAGRQAPHHAMLDVSQQELYRGPQRVGKSLTEAKSISFRSSIIDGNDQRLSDNVQDHSPHGRTKMAIQPV